MTCSLIPHNKYSRLLAGSDGGSTAVHRLGQWSTGGEPHEGHLEIGQEVLERFRPLLVRVEPQAHCVAAHLVPFNLVGQLERWLRLVSDIILLRIHRKLLEALEEDAHGLVVVGPEELGDGPVQLVGVLPVGNFRVRAHRDQLVLRKLKLAARGHRVKQKHCLAPSRVDLVPLDLDLRGAAHPEAVDRSKGPVVPDVEDVVVDVRPLEQFELRAGSFNLRHERVLLLVEGIQLKLVVVEPPPIVVLQLVQLLLLPVQAQPLLPKLLELLLQFLNLLNLFPLLLFALENLSLKLLLSHHGAAGAGAGGGAGGGGV
mmetsp:Transcript_4762/g.12091  ORF Transcript_4762/g.12091 Transcript_4762/m.12091 type:complete len:314 (+) Transcript_4762:59-1000(+)